MPESGSREELAWLVLNGSSILFSARPALQPGLRQAGRWDWAILALESLIITSATRHLPWRMRLYALVCHCYEDMNMHAESQAALERAKSRSPRCALRGAGPPPLAVQNLLTTAEKDCAIMQFKYKLISRSSSVDSAPAASTVEGVARSSPIGAEANYPRAIIETLTDFNARHLQAGTRRRICQLRSRPLSITPSSASPAPTLSRTKLPRVEAARGAEELPRSPREGDIEKEAIPDAGRRAASSKPSRSQIFLNDTPVTLKVPLAKELYRFKSFEAFKIVLASGLASSKRRATTKLR